MMLNHNMLSSSCRWAAFYLFAGLLSQLLPLASGLGLQPSLPMLVYLTGLVTQTNVTQTGIAATCGLVSHDRLLRFLHSLGWGLSLAACLAVRLVEALGVSGFIVVDDVLVPKPFAKMIAFCAWDYDHSFHRNSFGQRLVFVVWSNGSLTIPLLFAFWQKGPQKPRRKRRRRRRSTKTTKRKTIKGTQRRRRNHKPKARRVRLANGVHYRTKNELARLLVWKLVRRGLPSRFILFDNWFASRDNFRLFERLGLHWVTRAKSNMKVNYQGQYLSVKQVGATLKKADYHYYSGLKARVRSFEVEKDNRLLKLTVIKDDKGPEGGRTKYLLTNELRLTNREVVEWYRRRWVIEVFFRDAKQELGLGKSEVRSEKAVISHVVCVCIAYTLMQLLKPLKAESRPSIRASKNELAMLVMVIGLQGEREICRPRPSGEYEVVSFEHLIKPARTRLKSIALAENLVFT